MPNKTADHRPLCPVCETEMSLVKIKPGRSVALLNEVFQCEECHQERLVAIDKWTNEPHQAT